MRSNIKDLSKMLESLIKKSSEKEKYPFANSELIEELNFCIQGFSPFVTISEKIKNSSRNLSNLGNNNIRSFSSSFIFIINSMKFV